MIRITRLLTLVYVLALTLVGGAGVFIAEWELQHVFALDTAALGPSAEATLLNQYRFLKAIEFAAGVACLIGFKQIFAEPRITRLFLLLVGAGAGARILAIVADGWPKPMFLAFLAIELAVFVLVALHHVRHRNG